ncbi:hypothetical protein EMIHUDRAFT_198956 [Emiliania huxleyi CCMP1516]|uniref:Sfi1 spindle body domain-containing protein n=2 Tax=Emiliania huxleyi TaxID=2903 RepID=A0A0D3I222_EMIH1|nr:hypothetical protein EMIHUDRAFT_198956 [Emiliania huxleyi CCMP1516]EOD05307.1 hypothetical protein EMIHUDRAFT_198956 [Emiliania huxleyi CCMP1516]|eukprot:XP_005757736.1 hypothetical protein EMIHUDRAFT_198956 [Emiliania huxleyi CCMP1516]
MAGCGEKREIALSWLERLTNASMPKAHPPPRTPPTPLSTRNGDAESSQGSFQSRLQAGSESPATTAAASHTCRSATTECVPSETSTLRLTTSGVERSLGARLERRAHERQLKRHVLAQRLRQSRSWRGRGTMPWRALLNGKRLRTAAALAHRRERLCGAAFGGWLLLVSRAAAARGCKEGVLRICALRLRCRHTQRRGLIRMREMAAVHAERAAGALRAVRAGWLRRILAGWALVARAARDQQAAELLRRELEVVEALRRLHLRVAIAAWVARGERRRLRRAARAYKQQLLSRVDAWLEGMDASANTQGRQGSGRLLPRVPPLP